MPPRRVIVTGANGSGKTHLAARLGASCPGVPVICYDALRLTRDWRKRSAGETRAQLSAMLEQDDWIVEGGPSLLPLALHRADAVIWLDPPLWRRAVRMAIRPWRNRGRARPELPPGNLDWPMQQYRFAWTSLRRDGRFRRAVAEGLATAPTWMVLRCRTAKDVDAVVAAFTGP